MGNMSVDNFTMYRIIHILEDTSYTQHAIINYMMLMCFIIIHIHIALSLSNVCGYVLIGALHHGGAQTPKKESREGVYMDPNYTRQSPRKRRSGLLPSSPYKAGGVGGPTPPKQGRPSKYHQDRSCGDCTVWLQLGSPPQLKDKHSTKSRAFHPSQDNVVPWMSWLRKGGKEIDLRFDSCLCAGCYNDCVATSNKTNKKDKPRYYYQLNKTEKHCLVCHAKSSNACQCDKESNGSELSYVQHK